MDMHKQLLPLFFLIAGFTASAQTDTITFTKISGYEFDHPFLPYSAYTSIFNASGAPFIYAACRELGLVTFDISDIDNPIPVDTIPQLSLHNLKPTNVSQNGNYLYAALGGFDGLFPQSAGIAILDLDDPAHPAINDIWDSTAFNQGAAIAISDGEFAYIGAMDRGVIILNVSNKSNIKFISSVLPDPNFPEAPDLFSTPNARGLCLYGTDKLMVANDAGGLRMIDISDKENPVEIGKYANEGIESIAQSAYNNVVVVDHYAYIPVDMCGLDVVDIADENMETVYWYNPWDCDSSNWVGRPGHTNEIKLRGDSLLFVSGGDSEVLAFDITDRENPKLVGEYANVYDSIVAWALDIRDNYVSLALVNNEFLGIPYYSNIGGIYILEMNLVPYVDIINSDFDKQICNIVPNPADAFIKIKTNAAWQYLEIYDLSGKLQLKSEMENTIDIQNISPGIYFLKLFGSENEMIGATSFIRK